MRTVLLAATALIGVSAANANPATPSPPNGRYFLLTCTTPANAAGARETWTLGFDGKDGHAEFMNDANPADTARWGYYTPAKTTLTAVVGDPKSPMNLAMVDFGDHARLTWVQQGKSDTMECHFRNSTDVKPAVWHDPTTATTATTAPVAAPAAQPAASATTVAPAPVPALVATPLGSVPLTYDDHGANVAVSLGAMPVTMVVDTGAIGMTVTETVANWLVSNGQATNAPSEKKLLADGSEKEFKTIDINTLNVAGHEIHKVRAGVTADGVAMLLGLPILAQLSPKVGFDFPNAKLTFL